MQLETGPSIGQNDEVRSSVFPVASLDPGDTSKVKQFCGTGFFIGSRGFGMSAAHVATLGAPSLCALMVRNSTWFGFEIRDIEHHPLHDIAVFSVAPATDNSWRGAPRGSVDDTRASFGYSLWGYPQDTYIETIQDHGAPRPDLIYSAGHVRRRLSNITHPGIRGDTFLELSQVAGLGCSGGPLFGINLAQANLLLAGIYVGERLDQKATSVGYGVPFSAFGNWSPGLLGRTIRAEIASGAV